MIKEREVMDALPHSGFVRDYVDYAMSCTDSNNSYHLAAALTAITQTTPLSYAVPFASPIHSNLYTMIVGDSSKSRKTTAMNVMQNIMREALPGSIGEMPGSQEGLNEQLRSQQRQLVLYTEFGEFLSKAEQGYMMPLKTSLTSLWDCLSHDTEILAETGWKKKGEIKVGDLVYSMNTANDKLELVPVLDVGEREVRLGEKMAVTKTKRLSMRTTEGHDYYIRTRVEGKPNKKFSKKTGKDLSESRSAYYLPVSAQPANDFSGVDLTDDEIKFIAWCVTDGSLGDYKLVISQSKPDRIEEIRTILTNIGLDFTTRVHPSNEGTFDNAQPCIDFCIPKGTGSGLKARNGWYQWKEYIGKDISPLLAAMTKRQFHMFWKELLKGNGDNTKAGWESDGLYTSNKTQADNLMHMAVARGFSTNYGLRVTKNGVNMYRVTVMEQDYLQINPVKSKTELVDPEPGEIVWCVTNQNGTIVTRHEGRVAIIGNCTPIGRSLANSRRGAVTDPRLSLFCGVATSLLERHTDQADWTGGFIARFLTFHAEPERAFNSMPIPNATLRASLVNQLAAMADPTVVPGVCKWLDNAGKQIWDDWMNELRPLQKSASPRAQAACSRVSSMVCKIALLLCWDSGIARMGGQFHIGLHELECALKIGNLHVKSVLELGEMVTGNKDMRDRATVLRAIGTGTMPMGLVVRRSEMLKKRAKEIIETLIEERSIQPVQIGSEMCYRRTPEQHQMLQQLAETLSEGYDPVEGGPVDTSGVSKGAKIIPMLRPIPTPFEIQKERMDEDEDLYDEEGNLIIR